MIEKVKDILRHAYPYSKTNINKRAQLKKFKELFLANKEKPLKVVIGSGQRFTESWIPTEQHFLDLLKVKDWFKYFEENTLEGLLAEHVWEHLTPEQGKIAARTSHRFLKKGGRLRVAVPDGYHPNPEYIEYVRPGGNGAGADDHKVLYNYKTFSSLFQENGFKVDPIEYFDENGRFHQKDWTVDDGYVHRSLKYDERNTNGKPNYTSLILDAYKL